jgi:hypothetical protein
MYRTQQCPGWLALVNALRVKGELIEFPDKYGELGTLDHRALAGESVTLSDPEKKLVAQALELRDKVFSEWLVAAQVDQGAELDALTETRFWYRQGLTPFFSGCPDFVVIDRKRRRAITVNYKTGRKEAQPAADNLQLRTEVVLLKAAEPDLEAIDAVIIEPWVSWDSERVSYNAANLAQAKTEILAIVERAIREPETRIAGDHCFHCPARARCPEARKLIGELYRTGKEIKTAELPKGEKGSQIIENIATVRSILEAIEASYKELLTREPEALSDHFLHAGKTRREISDIKAARERLIVQGLADDEIDACATFWVGKLEEKFAAIKELKLGTKDRKAELAFGRALNGLIQTSTDAPYLARLSKKERASRAAALKEKNPE